MSKDDHGSYSTYTNYDCRCEKCRAANTAYYKAARERRRGLVESTVLVHGNESTYFNWRCTCLACKAAHAAAVRRRKAARRAL